MESEIKRMLKESILTKEEVIEKCLPLIKKSVNEIVKCYRKNGKLLVFGNGGSASDAQHFVGELVCKLKKNRMALPAIALTTNTSVITAWSNDFSFDYIFSRQIEALSSKKDIAFGISTSGNSKNVIEAIKKAKELNLKTICLLGKDGGKAKEIADISIIVPSKNTQRIQEAHITILHIIAELIEKNLELV